MRYTYALVVSVVIGCASHLHIERHHTTHLRRMPQITNVATGRSMKTGTFIASANLSYSLQVPDVMQISDSSFQSRSGMLGDEFTIITSSNALCYESRYSASGEALYAVSDLFAAGITFDASGGRLTGAVPDQGRTINDDCFEGGVVLAFSKQYDKFTVAIKPELLLTHLYGDRVWMEHDSTANRTVTATERVSILAAAVRSCSVLRYDFHENVSLYTGFHIKSQPYPKADDGLGTELSYGVYGGIDCIYRQCSVSPFVTIPLGASTSHFTSPVAAGLQLTFSLLPVDEQ